MSKIVSIVFLSAALTMSLGGLINADLKTAKLDSQYKLSINAINTVTFGDLNASYEMPVFKDSSFVLGVHFNPDKFQYAYTGKYGVLVGYKLYAADSVMDGPYFLTVVGYNHESINSNFTDLLSLEFWIGNTWRIEKNIHVDAGIGLGRKYDPNQKSQPALLGGINIGFHFPDKLFWLI